MKKYLMKVPAALLALLLVVALLPISALAAEASDVRLPVSISLEGEDFPEPKEEYRLKLTALDGAPMPEGAQNGAYVMTVEGPGRGSFPTIRYSRVGVYKYTISQLPGEHPRGHYDGTAYSVTVSVINAQGGGLETIVVMRGSGDGKLDSAGFVNKYDPEREDVTVMKRWSGGRSSRPESVEVSLIVGGETVDTAVLSAKNDWTHTWEKAVEKGDNTWKVKESPVKGRFLASYRYSYSTYSAIVTNTYTENLIQTGQLNWPIPVLCCLGFGLMAFGAYTMLKKRENENA